MPIEIQEVAGGRVLRFAFYSLNDLPGLKKRGELQGYKLIPYLAPREEIESLLKDLESGDKEIKIFTAGDTTTIGLIDVLQAKQGTHYDLFPRTVGAGIDNFSLNSPYTLEANSAVNDGGGNGAIFYEPTHLRGRALASFSGNANLGPCTGLPTNQYLCIGNGGPGTEQGAPRIVNEAR